MAERFFAGQKFTGLSATSWNEFCDVADAVKRGGRQSASGGLGSTPSIIRIRNDSGTARDIGEVLGLDVPLIDPGSSPSTDTANEFRRQVAFSGVTPDVTKHLGRFAVLAEPLPDGEIGSAYIGGACPALVTVSHVDHQFAEIADGEYILQSSWQGSMELLYKPAATGDKLCTVRFGDTKPIPYVNRSGATIPAFGLLRLLPASFTGGRPCFEGRLSIGDPTALAVNGPVDVADGDQGTCSVDFPAVIAYDTTAALSFPGPPFPGATCGPGYGGSLAKAGRVGFDVLGVVDSTAGFVLVKRSDPVYDGNATAISGAVVRVDMMWTDPKQIVLSAYTNPGNFKLRFYDGTVDMAGVPVSYLTGSLTDTATASDVQTALRAIAAIGTDVACANGPLQSHQVEITFSGAWQYGVRLIEVVPDDPTKADRYLCIYRKNSTNILERVTAVYKDAFLTAVPMAVTLTSSGGRWEITSAGGSVL